MINPALMCNKHLLGEHVVDVPGVENDGHAICMRMSGDKGFAPVAKGFLHKIEIPKVH